jgi:hypothetical protein
MGGWGQKDRRRAISDDLHIIPTVWLREEPARKRTITVGPKGTPLESDRTPKSTERLAIRVLGVSGNQSKRHQSLWAVSRVGLKSGVRTLFINVLPPMLKDVLSEGSGEELSGARLTRSGLEKAWLDPKMDANNNTNVPVSFMASYVLVGEE